MGWYCGTNYISFIIRNIVIVKIELMNQVKSIQIYKYRADIFIDGEMYFVAEASDFRAGDLVT